MLSVRWIILRLSLSLSLSSGRLSLFRNERQGLYFLRCGECRGVVLEERGPNRARRNRDVRMGHLHGWDPVVQGLEWMVSLILVRVAPFLCCA